MARKTTLRKRPLFPESRDLRDYLHQTLELDNQKRPTAAQIAVALDLSLNRTQTLIKEGVSSEDAITLARYYGLNPVTTLADFGFITDEEIQHATTAPRAVEDPQTEESTYQITARELCKALERHNRNNISFFVNLPAE